MTDTLSKGGLLENRYKILSRIGEGGMGVVYKAEHIVLHKKCAIKVLHPTEAEDQTMIKRFKVEAQAAANIRHPNVVEVMDFGITPDGRPFFVMEHLTGESLADRLDRKKNISEKEIFGIAKEILKGLAAAHRVGVIHRDLKPENIFLAQDPGTDETVKILDFGISKIMGGTPSMPAPPISSEHKALTQKGVVFGTPGYMAPESLFGTGGVDSRADLFAVGVILFEMSTGQQPFQAHDAHATMLATASKSAASPSSIRPNITKSLEKVIIRGLVKDPDKRYQTAEEYLQDLRKIDLDVKKKVEKSKNPYARPKAKSGTSGQVDDYSEYPNPYDTQKPENTSIELDDSYLEERSFSRRPQSPKNPYQRDSYIPKLKDGKSKRKRAWRIGFAVSPLPVLFFIALGGSAYYFFVHKKPMVVSDFEDPVDRDIRNRSKQRSIQESEEIPKESIIPVETVTIWIKSRPRKVNIQYDGKLYKKGPLVIPRSLKEVDMHFSAKGYRNKTLSIIPDQPQTIEVRLKKR